MPLSEPGTMIASSMMFEAYEGVYTKPDGGQRPAVLKSPLDPEGWGLLDHEQAVLKEIWKRIDSEEGFRFFGHTMPWPYGTHESPSGEKFSVTKRYEGYTTDDLRQRLGGKIPPEHVAWMLTRLLTTLAAAHQFGWCHNAVLPHHVLVRWENDTQHRFAKILDWKRATKIGEPFPGVIPTHSRFYPPEAFSKDGKATPSSDIYMFGQLALWLLGGDQRTRKVPEDVPQPLRGVIHSCLIPNVHRRTDDAADLLFNHLRPALAEIWGSPKYVELNLPEVKET